MLESITRIRFTWDPEFRRCRATAHDATDGMLGEVVVELPAETQRRIWALRGGSMQFRMEELAERHLRATLELRY